MFMRLGCRLSTRYQKDYPVAISRSMLLVCVFICHNCTDLRAGGDAARFFLRERREVVVSREGERKREEGRHKPFHLFCPSVPP